jgi:hypothetical protein
MAITAVDFFQETGDDQEIAKNARARSDAFAWPAIDVTSPGPWPTARKMSNSMAAFKANVRWKA